MHRRVIRHLVIASSGILLAFCSSPSQPTTNNNNNGNNTTPTCGYSVTPSASLPASGGNGSVTVTQTGNTACQWTATTTNNANNWLTLTGSTSASGSGSVPFSAGSNATSNQLSATIAFSWSGGSASSAISQDAAAAGTCIVSLSSSTQSEPFNGRGDQFQVNPSAACGTWQVSADVPWITNIAPSSSTGTRVVNFTVLANTTGVRTGTITVTSGSSSPKLTVTQDSGVLTPVLKITSTTGKGDNTCDLIAVGSNAGIQCTFDGSQSSPSGGISKYEYFITDTGTSLGTGPILPPSGATVTTTCAVLSKVAKDKTGTKLTPTIKLTITSTDGHIANSAPQLITLTSTGPC